MSKNKVFINLTESLFNNEGIYISAICTRPHFGISEFNECRPTPDIVLMDAHWPNNPGKDLFLQFLITKAKIILITAFPEMNILKHFSPLHPQGYFFKSCDDFKIIIDCIKRVYKGSNCYTTIPD
jgi:DNA-binding NarL/FixJ family response regulator